MKQAVLLFLLWSSAACAQDPDELTTMLNRLYQGFPFDSGGKFIGQFASAGSSARAIVWSDSSKTEYIILPGATQGLENAPDSVVISCTVFSDRRKGGPRTTTTVNMYYRNSWRSGHRQFRQIAKKLEELSYSTSYEDVFDPLGKAGRRYFFFLSENNIGYELVLTMNNRRKMILLKYVGKEGR